MATDIVIAIIIYIPLILAHKYVPKHYADLFSVMQMAYYWPMFIFGFIARKYSLLDKFSRHNWILTVSFIGYAVCLYALSKQRMPLVIIIMGLLASLSITLLFKTRENSTSIAEYQFARIGRHSLDVYIYHYFFSSMFDLSLPGKWLFSTDNYFLEATLLFTISICCAYASIIVGRLIRTSNLLRLIIYGER